MPLCLVPLSHNLIHVVKTKDLLGSRFMVPIPLGLERGVVDLINSKEGKRVADGMNWTGFPNLQNRWGWLPGELSYEFKLGPSKDVHRAILIENRPTSGNLDHTCPRKA